MGNLPKSFVVKNCDDFLKGVEWMLKGSSINEKFIKDCCSYQRFTIESTSACYKIKFTESNVWPIHNEYVCIGLMVERPVFAVTKHSLSKICYDFSELVDYGEEDKIDYPDWKAIKTLARAGNPDFVYFVNTGIVNEFVLFDGTEKKYRGVVNLTSAFKEMIVDNNYMLPWQYPWSCKEPAKPENIKNEKETTKEMNMPNVNFDFGPCGDSIALSPYGLAIRSRDSKWLTYNPNAGNTVDVTGFTFDFKGMIYKVPVAISEIKAGDMIMHQGKPMFVTAVNGNDVSTIDIIASEAKNIVPVTNPFGFNFVTKITSLMNLSNTTPDPNNPFGNFMPMMIWSEILNGSEENSERGKGLFGGLDIGKMMMLSAMTGQGNPLGSIFNFGGFNPNPNPNANK